MRSVLRAKDDGRENGVVVGQVVGCLPRRELIERDWSYVRAPDVGISERQTEAYLSAGQRRSRATFSDLRAPIAD